jgi:ubiquinone/menaquinone biosynthesis C-methylase UbiE
VHEREAISPDAAREYRQRSYLNWERAAAGWERERAFVSRATRPLTRWLEDALAPRPGETLLELAAGPGDTSLELAPRVAPGGRVLCTDRSPAMVEAAARAARARGLDWVDCRVVDAEALDLPEACVDAAFCRLALMLMPDPGRVLEELRRVLRPGGRLAVVVWDAPEHNAWATALWDVLESRTDLPPAVPGGPGMFALGDAARLEALLAAAGFDVPRLERVPMTWAYPSFERFWEVQSALNGSLVGLLARLGDAERAELADAVAEAVEGFRVDGGGYALPGRAIGALAVCAAAAPPRR